ncbi:PDC sensor domain-containing protein [Halosimplex salinum]|uniref:PDC sensor domain-containing protein n=1 Tax=Halosimplex salinum TaxID=1710538 RepID=UPI000F461F52|nr:methyl-accepting chemotaxis protein [Halosimplex salinum]
MSGGGAGGAVLGVVRTVVPDAIRKRFALKFLIVLLLMGLAIGAVGVLATGQITTETQDRIENEYSSLADQEATIITQWVDRNRQSARLASNNDVWASEDTSSVERAAVELQSDTTDIDEVHVVSADGSEVSVVASTELDASDSIAGTSREYVADLEFASIGQVKTSTVYEAGGDTVVGFVSPVGNGDRYLVLESAVDELAGEFQGSRRAESGFTQVVDGDGTILIDERMGDDDSAELFSTYGDEAARQPIRDANAIRDQRNPNGVSPAMPAQSNVIDEEYAVGYAPIFVTSGPEEWVVLVHAPTSEVFGFVQTISDFGLVATGAAVLLMGLIGVVLGYNTSSSIDRLTRKAEAMEAGDLDVEIETGRIDNVGRLYGAFGSMRDSLKAQIQEAEQARKEAEVSRSEAMAMSSYLQERAEEYSEIMQAAARGDLTRRMEPEDENEAMDQIATDFNEMIAELEMTTGQLKTFAREVEESGRSVQQSAETVRDASEQVAESIQKISDDAYNQKERLQDVSEDMDSVAERLETFEAEADQVDFGDSLRQVREIAAALNTAVDLGEETMAESENVAGAAEEQAAELNEVSSRAEELVRYAQYLGDGLGNFETEEEHEFVFQTGAGGPGGDGPEPTDD